MLAWRKYLAELIGTFVLVFCGCGAAVVLGCTGSSVDAAYVGTALAFGLSIVAMAYSIGNISGCHINPAVSLAMLIDSRMSVKDFVGYVISQCIGAILAAAALGCLLGWTGSFGSNGLYNGSVLASLVIEIILTFIFVLAILGVTSKVENGAVAGLVIGLSLVLVHLVGIHFTGTSVNPARSLTAIFAGGTYLSALWVFIVAPLVGGAFAALVWRVLIGEDDEEETVEKEKVVEEISEPEQTEEIADEEIVDTAEETEEVGETEEPVEKEEKEPVDEVEADTEVEADAEVKAEGTD